MPLRIALFTLAALLMAAHFLRAGQHALVALCLLTPGLFLLRRRLSLYLLQFAAYCASATWLAATLQLIQFRQQLGRPWTTGALILGAVTALTLLAGLLLNARCMRQRYP